MTNEKGIDMMTYAYKDITPSDFTEITTNFIKTAISPKTHEVDKVIFNEPATIVMWKDGTKTVVKCHPDDLYDEERGFLLCCAKKLLGGGKYNDVMRKHIPSRDDIKFLQALDVIGRLMR